MGRGKDFNHKNKSHPGNFPAGAEKAKRPTTEAQEDEEFLVVQEAFKNRVEEDEV
jgi:hypothetical protein